MNLAVVIFFVFGLMFILRTLDLNEYYRSDAKKLLWIRIIRSSVILIRNDYFSKKDKQRAEPSAVALYIFLVFQILSSIYLTVEHADTFTLNQVIYIGVSSLVINILGFAGMLYYENRTEDFTLIAVEKIFLLIAVSGGLLSLTYITFQHTLFDRLVYFLSFIFILVLGEVDAGTFTYSTEKIPYLQTLKKLSSIHFHFFVLTILITSLFNFKIINYLWIYAITLVFLSICVKKIRRNFPAEDKRRYKVKLYLSFSLVLALVSVIRVVLWKL